MALSNMDIITAPLSRVLRYVLEDAKGKFSPSLKNISASGDPSIVSHPLVSVVVELLWAGVVRRQFIVSRIWNILNLVIFVMGQEITPSMIVHNGPSNELYSLLFLGKDSAALCHGCSSEALQVCRCQ